MTSYQYDAANRLSSVDGVAYTFDNNGNLLNDGTNTYTYDSANRLISVNGTSLYTYSGLGDRLSQTVNGQVTNYTLDLNSGLTQVLSDGTTSYTYGLGRISQTSTTAEYFLGDALGSVRQLTNSAGEVTFAKSYDPYGAVTQVSGEGGSAYGFTGEMQSNDMVYLRARYYSPREGRFQSRDTWEGDGNNPITLNRWVYANANPIRYIDPSGNSAVQSIISNALRRAGVGSSVPGGINSYGINCSSTGGEPRYWFYFAIGTLDQYLEDMTIGIFQADDNYNHIQVYQQGRNFGHSVSLTQAMIETIIGLALAEAALSSIPPTIGGGSLCAGVTGGGCIVIALPVVGVEVIVLVGASLINLHGAAMIARAASDGGGGGGEGRPSSNIAQNRQFKGAVKEIERQIGRPLTKFEIRRLHDSIHHLEDPGFWDIVNEGLSLFGD